MSVPVSTATIERRILLIRGQRVMLDSDLGDLYGVSTKRLNEQVRRNIRRFPVDFMFRLSPDEAAALRSQNATLETGRGKHRNRAGLRPASRDDCLESGIGAPTGGVGEEVRLTVQSGLRRHPGADEAAG